MDDGMSRPLVGPGASKTHAGPNHEAQGHEMTREVFAAGTLPTRPADHVWGGPGAGGECATCGVRLTRDELELEAEFAGEDDRAGAVNLHFHVRCYMAWERQRVASEAVARISVTANGHEQAPPRSPLAPPAEPDRSSR
jgi:hypothetical protein